MKSVSEMIYDELVSEWLACERAVGDPIDDRQAAQAASRQLEVEKEQDRRDNGEDVTL